MTILPTKKAAKDKSDQDKAAEHPGHPHGHGHNHTHAHNHTHGHTHFHYSSGNESRHDKGARARTAGASREDNVEARGTFDGHESATKYHKRRHKSPHRTARKHRGHSAVTTHQPPPPLSPHSPSTGSTEPSTDQDDMCSGYNSEDEHLAFPEPFNAELEAWFEQSLKAKKGFVIKKMREDGSCLFRAVADQVFGDQEMHADVRRQCMDFIAQNQDHFQNFVTEDIQIYLNRKRTDDCHGNAIELQAMSEVYNRPIEVYKYDLNPLNVGQGFYKTDNAPIRLSYHQSCHYNSVIDPFKATIGVGLGLPGLKPGLADENLMQDAMGQSENTHIEQAMLKDKMRETDWELTQEAMEEQVARESYRCWLQENEKRQLMTRAAQGRSPSATCSTSAEGSSTSMVGSPESGRGSRSPRNRSNPTSSQNSPQHVELAGNSSELTLPSQTSLPMAAAPECSASSSGLGVPVNDFVSPSAVGGAFGFSETNSLMNSYPSSALGFPPWEEEEEEDPLLQQVLAQSEQEYYDSLKRAPGAVPANEAGEEDSGSAKAGAMGGGDS